MERLMTLRHVGQLPRTLILLLALLLPLASIGCGKGRKPSVYPTHGEVFVAGQPAEGATVIFLPKPENEIKVTPTAVVAADGSFDLTTFKSGDGCPKGDYTVLVIWDKTEIVEREEVVLEPDKLGYRYANAGVSPLKATVKKGKNQIERFDLQ
jgi:hypothetical protein